MVFLITVISVGVIKDLLNQKIQIVQITQNPWKYVLQIDYKNYFITFWEKDPINGLGWIVIAYTLFTAFKYILSGRYKQQKAYELKSEYASHGSARFQTKQEILKNYYNGDGLIIGDISDKIYDPRRKNPYAQIPINGEKNLQTIVFGPPGSQKTTAFVMPNIIHTAIKHGWSQVITDPKGELYAYIAPFLKEQGYDVHVLDFLHLKRGNSINFLDYVYDELDLLRIADSYITGGNVALIGKARSNSDPIWDQGEMALLGALMGFVKQVYRNEPRQQTLYRVASILNTEFQDVNKYKYLFLKHRVTGTAEHLFNNFLLAKDKVRDGILFGLATKLQLFSIPDVQNITMKSDFFLEDIGKRKIALFVMMSDSERTFSPIITVFWSLLFSAIYKVRLLNEGDIPVLCMMDELANIGRIGGLQEKLGTMRSRKIYPQMIWQSLPQLKDRYPDNGWLDIISMCDNRILLGANDNETKQYFSNEMGTTTVKVHSISENKRRERIDISTSSRNQNFTSRKLMFPDEIGKISNDQLLVLQKGEHPVKLYKCQYKYWLKEYQICEPSHYNEIPLLQKAYVFNDRREHLHLTSEEHQDDEMDIDLSGIWSRE